MHLIKSYVQKYEQDLEKPKRVVALPPELAGVRSHYQPWKERWNSCGTQGGQLELLERAAWQELQPAVKKSSLPKAGQLGRARGTNPPPSLLPSSTILWGSSTDQTQPATEGKGTQVTQSTVVNLLGYRAGEGRVDRRTGGAHAKYSVQREDTLRKSPSPSTSSPGGAKALWSVSPTPLPPASPTSCRLTPNSAVSPSSVHISTMILSIRETYPPNPVE